MNLLKNKFWIYVKIMFGFIKRRCLELLSVCAIGSFGESLVSNSKGPIKCVSLSKHPCQARPTIVNINSDETLFFYLLLVVKSAMEVVTLLMIYMLEFAFQIK